MALFVAAIAVPCTSAASDLAILAEQFSRSCLYVVEDQEQISCMEAYVAFLQSFRGQQHQSVDYPPDTFQFNGYYDSYFNITFFNKPISNSALFWPYTTPSHPLQRALAFYNAEIQCFDNKYPTVIIHDMINIRGIKNWCSNRFGEISINDNCDTQKFISLFWIEASKRMATNVIGNAYILTKNAEFDSLSSFGLYSLTSLLADESGCTSLTVLNVTPFYDGKCGSDGLHTLQVMVGRKRLYQCYNVQGSADNLTQELVSCLKHITDAISQGNVLYHIYRILACIIV